MEFDDDILIEAIEEEEEEVMSKKPIIRAAMRRKQDWKHAKRRMNILNDKNDKIVKAGHFYSKTMPSSNAVDKRQTIRQTRQNDNFKNQLNDLGLNR